MPVKQLQATICRSNLPDVKCILRPTLSMKIRNAKYTSDFGQRRRQNVGHVTLESKSHFAILIHNEVVPDILAATTFQNQNEKISVWLGQLP